MTPAETEQWKKIVACLPAEMFGEYLCDPSASSAGELEKQWKEIQPSGVAVPEIFIESTPPYPGEFVQEFLGMFVGPETTETPTFPKSGSNRAAAISRGASQFPVPWGLPLPKRGSRGLQRVARGASGVIAPEKATPVCEPLKKGGEA